MVVNKHLVAKVYGRKEVYISAKVCLKLSSAKGSVENVLLSSEGKRMILYFT